MLTTTQIKLCKCIIYTLFSVGYLSFLMIELYPVKINEDILFVLYNIFAAITILFNIIYVYSLSENIFFASTSKILLLISILVNFALVILTVITVLIRHQETYLLFIYNGICQLISFTSIIIRYQINRDKTSISKSPSTEKLLG